MTTTARDVYVVGLRNAHAMEVQARELMERQSERLGDYPDVQAKVKEHLAETNEQLKRLDGIGTILLGSVPGVWLGSHWSVRVEPAVP